mgnify:CR=1 FL=1
MSKKHQNLLVIITDQERRVQHFPNNWEQDHLPNMTLLKSYGIDFEQAQCNSCMCTPSRSVLFTGKYPSETGMTATLSWGGPQSPAETQLDPSLPNMANMLNSVYDTQYRGKWHLSKGEAGENSLTSAEVGLYGFMGWTAPDAGEDSKNVNFGGGYANHDHAYINQAIDYIKQYKEDIAKGIDRPPFCLVVSLVNPHDVLAYPSNFEYGYRNEDLVGNIELPASWDENLLTNLKPEAQSQLKAVMKFALGGLPYIDQKRNYINFYGNLLKKIDGEIGRLLDLFYSQADSNGKRQPEQIAKDTWIVRTSDHGELGMAHGGLRQKAFTVYEETVRVPLVFSNPVHFPSPQSTDELVGLLDVLPTLGSLLNMSPDFDKKGLRGVDMSPVIRQLGTGFAPHPADNHFKSQEGILFAFDDVKAGSNTNPSSVQAPNRIRCVRTKNYKYARYFIAEGTWADEYEFYDLVNDPNELNNLGNPRNKDYNTAPYPAIRKQMQDLLAKLEVKNLQKPPMRVPAALGIHQNEFTPRLAPIFTQKGVAYQIGAYFITGMPTDGGFAAAQNMDVKTAINLSGMPSPNDKYTFNFIDLSLKTEDQGTFNSQMDQVVTAMESQPLLILVYDMDSNLSGAAWACYLGKKEGIDSKDAIQKGLQVGLRKPETIAMVQSYLNN